MKCILIGSIVLGVMATVWQLWKLHRDCKDLNKYPKV